MCILKTLSQSQNDGSCVFFSFAILLLAQSNSDREGMLVVSGRAWGYGGLVFKKDRVSVREDETVLEADGHHNMNCLMSQTCTLQMAKAVNS
jgi:hypothetical protein